MLLDIIVPHAKEPWEVVRPFFDVINSQKGIDFNDFRVLLVHDGVAPFPERYFDGPAHVEQMVVMKGGVSSARNWGLEHAKATWVNFSDCGDCYSSIFSLLMIFNVLKDEKAKELYDVMWAPFYMSGGNNLAEFKNFNAVFIHNKYYNREFLMKKGIRFCERLYMSEDSAFNQLVRMETVDTRFGKIDTPYPMYSWCRREGSITMTKGNWLKITEGHFDRNVYVAEEYLKHGDKRRAILVVCRTLTDVYVMTNKAVVEFVPAHILKKAREFYNEYKYIYDNATKEEFNKAFGYSDSEFLTTKEEKENRIPYDEWFNKYIKTEEKHDL